MSSKYEWQSKLTACRACGRTFTTDHALLQDEKHYCRRALPLGGYCNDKRCERVRRLNKRDARDAHASYGKIKHISTENKIKQQEQG